MGKISYKYLPEPWKDQNTGQEEMIYKPKIYVRFSSGHGNPSQIIEALIDSGADRSLLPIGIADILGINYKKVKQVKIMGIGGVIIDAYSLKVNLWLDNKKYPTEADFSPQQQNLLLGRKGFFDLFKKVSFNEGLQMVEIETKD